MNELLEKLRVDFPDLRFVPGRKFAFRFPKTVILGPHEPFSELLLLPEVSHAILEHKDFRTDVERLKMESLAWEEARKLALRYEVEFDDEFAEGELDSYRDWLHKKSRCPSCGLTRFQDVDGYHCPSCSKFKRKTK